MGDELKFYEEKMHERELPNISGQYRKGSKYGDQDWYGNKLILDRPKAYFGEAQINMEPEELSFNPKTIFNYVDNQVREFLKRLIEIVPDSNLNLDNLQTFIRRVYGHRDSNDYAGRSVYVFEDDGYTRAEGFHYVIHWALPLSDRNQFLESAVANDFACDTIVFKLEFTERIHDSNISSRFFSLYFNGITSEDKRGNKIDARIDYNNDNMTMNSIITPENLFRVGKKLIEFNQDKDFFTKVNQAFEQ